MTETATYLYAIGRRPEAAPAIEGQGLQDAAIRSIEYRGLVAVVSTVGLDEFGESALRRNLEDLRWLERTARRHDEVVRAAAAVTSAIAPFRLATICRSDDGVRERIDTLYDDLVRALDRIEGRSEWSVKAFVSVRRPTAADQPSGQTQTAGSGVAYLERRRAELRAKEAATARDELVSEALFWDLSAGAEAARRLAAQDQRLSARSEPMVLNGTFLVDDPRAGDFAELVEQLRQKYSELQLELTGPWPPYSFATLDDET
ncbi:GvpL/GvpF family gas vesicle protein [Kribbella sp. CA-253562]|uniref:GvpL/GvpF family gas vesicle protein n=1 Tax=Kribbella sp. CA-253562 TaxID=3239942 RepID=UPI003D8EF05A